MYTMSLSTLILLSCLIFLYSSIVVPLYVYFFIVEPSAGFHLCWLHFLALFSSAAVNTNMQLSLLVDVECSEYVCPGNSGVTW